MITLTRKQTLALALGAAALIAALIGVIWWQSIAIHDLDIQAETREWDGYRRGRLAERARNPATVYMEDGQGYCYDGGKFQAKKKGKKYKVVM